MIQIGSYLDVVDNSGAKKALCIKIVNAGYRQRYAFAGSVIIVSIKTVRISRANKAKKGEMYKALIIKAKTNRKIYYGYRFYIKNEVVLLHKQNKFLGTRIFSLVPKEIKYSKFLKIVVLSAGVSF